MVLAAAVSPYPGYVAPAALAAPQAVVETLVKDFGTVFEDKALTHTYVLKNTGDAPLKILEVDPDCNCTVPNYDRAIPQGGEGKVTLTIKPYSVIHEFKKDTKVRLNDPARPEIVLVMKGVAKPFIEIQPSHIVRLRGTPGKDLKGQLLFTSHLAEPFTITEFRTNIPDKVKVSLQEVQPGRVFVLEVANQASASGPYSGLVELFTNVKERPRLIVRVFGELYLPSAGSP